MASSKSSKTVAKLKAAKLNRRLERINRQAVQLRDMWAPSADVNGGKGELGLKSAKELIKVKFAAERRERKRRKTMNKIVDKPQAEMQADYDTTQKTDETGQAMDLEQDSEAFEDSDSEDDSEIEHDGEADEVTEAEGQIEREDDVESEQHIKREDNVEAEPEIKIEKDSDNTYIGQHDEAREQGRAAWPRLSRAPASVDLIEYSRELSAHFQTIKAVINDGGGEEGTIELPRCEISYLAERTHLVLDGWRTSVNARVQTFAQMQASTEATQRHVDDLRKRLTDSRI